MRDRETPVASSSIRWRLFGGLLLGSLVLGMFSVLRPFSLTFGDHLFDALRVLYALILALVCFHGSWKLLRTPLPPGAGKRMGGRFIPVLLGMSVLWVALALSAWVYEAIGNQQAPTYPSLFHVLIFGMYPFFIAAVVLLPSQNLSRLSRLRGLLDSLIIMTTVATLYVYVILIPILVTTKGTFLDKTVGSLFTAADLVLLFCLLFAALQTIHGVIRQVIALLTLSMVILLGSHVFHLSLVLSTQASLTIRPSPGLIVSLTLVAVAAQMMRRVLEQCAFTEHAPAVLLEETEAFVRWKNWFMSALVLIFVLLLVFLAIQPANAYTYARFQVVVYGGTGLLIVLTLRQWLVTHELNVLKQDLREKNALLDKLAASDPLTGVPNYRTLMTRLDEVLARAKEQQTMCSVVFMDIDHFKAINDRYGHAVGDQVLCQVTKLAASLLRPEDCLGRWGGEEFVAVLPGQDLTEAFTIAERIRTQVSEQVFADQGDLRVTCSLGVATYPQMATEREQLLICADRAMYEAKHHGRNQTRLAELLKG